MKSLFRRWKAAGQARLELDVLLGQADPSASIRERLDWLVELLGWTRIPGHLELPGATGRTGQLQATRVRYLLLMLERQPEWKRRSARHSPASSSVLA